MSNDFRLLMLTAMYENGGNTTHRFLDGHPQLHVYPFESQLGTVHVRDGLASMFPLKYRWPRVPARRHTRDGLRRDHRRGGQGARAHAPRQQVPPCPLRRQRCGATRALLLVRRPHRPARAVATSRRSLRATHHAWKNERRSGEETVYVGYSPCGGHRRREDASRISPTLTSCTSCAIHGQPTPTPRSAPSHSRWLTTCCAGISTSGFTAHRPRAQPRAGAHPAHRGHHGRSRADPRRAARRELGLRGLRDLQAAERRNGGGASRRSYRTRARCARSPRRPIAPPPPSSREPRATRVTVSPGSTSTGILLRRLQALPHSITLPQRRPLPQPRRRADEPLADPRRCPPAELLEGRARGSETHTFMSHPPPLRVVPHSGERRVTSSASRGALDQVLQTRLPARAHVQGRARAAPRAALRRAQQRLAAVLHMHEVPRRVRAPTSDGGRPARRLTHQCRYQAGPGPPTGRRSSTGAVSPPAGPPPRRAR